MTTGDFSYVNTSGDDYTLRNPCSGKYLELVGGALRVVNRTNTRAILCKERGSRGSRLVIYPGASGSFGGAAVPDLVIFD
ncbi:hypothetical protein ACFQZZ_19250 [Nocardia sp. GCM10030253]|uniref:hypothetical protein n=1 Tax=Nocardia sp. GCM10030253 TaxID=3273404 RepID=UPI00363E0FFD